MVAAASSSLAGTVPGRLATADGPAFAFSGAPGTGVTPPTLAEALGGKSDSKSPTHLDRSPGVVPSYRPAQLLVKVHRPSACTVTRTVPSGSSTSPRYEPISFTRFSRDCSA